MNNREIADCAPSSALARALQYLEHLVGFDEHSCEAETARRGALGFHVGRFFLFPQRRVKG